MDIIKIDFAGEELPVSFPFEALVDVQGDIPLSTWLATYTTLKSQIEILKIGLKYGGVEKTHVEVRELAVKNPRKLFEVFKLYEQEATTFYNGYFAINDDEEATKPTKEEKKKAEERGKPGALGQ